MRVIHVAPGIDISIEAQGPAYSVIRLCESLIEAGEELTLAALNWPPIPSIPAFMKAFPLGMGPGRLGRSPEMCRWLMEKTAAGKVDVIHNHGMWQMNAIYPGRATKGRKTKLVVSPRGTFSKWAMNYGSRSKVLFWSLLQRPALVPAACFHATAESEYEDIRRLGFKQPVAVIPNGIDVQKFVKRGSRETRNLLFLGRIHPVKGVDILLNAWASVMDRFPNWRLSIAGPDAASGKHSGYNERMKALAADLQLKRVEFLGPLYGDAKLSAYREADLFVLPTHSENFGMTVAEALAAGTPAIVTKGAPWRGLNTHKSGWWIDIGIDSLVPCLHEAMAKSPGELARYGINGREWMIREFSWQTIGQRMDQTYHWVIEGGEVPSWIITD